MVVSGAAVVNWLSVADREDDTPRTRRLLRLVEPAREDSESAGANQAGSVLDHHPLVTYGGESWRLYPDGSLRRWDVSAECWKSIWRGAWDTEDASFVDGEGPPTITSDLYPPIEGCTCLGGTLQSLCMYGKYTLVFERDALKVFSHQAGTIEIPASDLVSVAFEGRGRVGEAAVEHETFSFPRVVDDMAAAPVVRSLVARTRMDTSLRIETGEGEAVFHCESATPDELRTSLAPFLTTLRRGGGRPEENGAEENGANDGVAKELVKLADLKSRGLLTDEEFAVAKAMVLGVPHS